MSLKKSASLREMLPYFFTGGFLTNQLPEVHYLISKAITWIMILTFFLYLILSAHYLFLSWLDNQITHKIKEFYQPKN